jgi:hypothetical protein
VLGRVAGGGIARTENYKGYYFDMGGHRFYNKSRKVNELAGCPWRRFHACRGYPEFTTEKYFYYPLKAINALVSLGVCAGDPHAQLYQVASLSYNRKTPFEQCRSRTGLGSGFSRSSKPTPKRSGGSRALSLANGQRKESDLSFAGSMSMVIKPKETIKSQIEEFDYRAWALGCCGNRVKDIIERQDGRYI